MSKRQGFVARFPVQLGTALRPAPNAVVEDVKGVIPPSPPAGNAASYVVYVRRTDPSAVTFPIVVHSLCNQAPCSTFVRGASAS